MFVPSSNIYGNQDEANLFTLHQSSGADLAAMFHKPATSFLKVHGLRLAHSHPAVKHAFLAFSSSTQSVRYYNFAERTICEGKYRYYRRGALRHANKAIHHLTHDSPESTPVEVYAACSLFFTATDCWPQPKASAHVHASAGLRLCQDVLGKQLGSQSPMDYVHQLLCGLTHYLVAILDGFSVTPEAGSIVPPLVLNWKVPRFEDVGCGITHINRLILTISRLAAKQPEARKWEWNQVEETRQHLRERVEETLAMFGPADPLAKHDLSLLRLHLQVFELIIRTTPHNDDEMTFDLPENAASFRSILTQVKSLLAVEADPASGRGPDIFHSMLGLLAPLFLITTKCRDSQIRREALEVMHSSFRREKSWNSCVASIISRTVIEAEHKAAVCNLRLGEAVNVRKEDRVRIKEVEFLRHGNTIVTTLLHWPYGEEGRIEKVVSKWYPESTDESYEVVRLTKKCLRVYGYTGIALLAPRVRCQCGP